MSNNPLFKSLGTALNAYNDVLYFVDNKLEFDLFQKSRDVLAKFYDPVKQYNELVVCAGMSSGKTVMGAVIALYEVYRLIQFKHPASLFNLPAEEELFITNVATSERQAKDTVFAKVKMLIDHSPYLQDTNIKQHYNEFQFPNGVKIRSEHSNSSSLVGKVVKAGLLDELARFVDTSGRSSAEAVYTAVSRTVQKCGMHGKLISISSPLYHDDFFYGWLYQQANHFPRMLGFKYPTWESNPNMPRDCDAIMKEFLKNPETAERDYGAEPSSAIQVYYRDPAKIDKAVEAGVAAGHHHPIDEDGQFEDWFRPIPNIMYYASGDPALRNDAFGFAMVHQERGKVITDILHRFLPPEGEREVDAEEVKNFLIGLLDRGFNIVRLVTDQWNFPETLQAIRKRDVLVEQHYPDKKTHDKAKEAIYTGQALLYYHPHFIKELKELEQIRGVKVDHRKGGTDDIADAFANAVYQCTPDAVDDGYAPVWVVVKDA